jgi:lauroyl/myristoyl acyltransferase
MRIPVGAVYLAWRSGARLHPLYTVREGRRYRSVIGPELAVARAASLDDALEAGADVTASYLDSVLRAHPGAWHFWDDFQPGGLLA